MPVLMTPIPRRCWREGQLIDLHGEYPKAIRLVAQQKGVPLLDITREGMKALQEMGEEATRELFMNVAPGLYPAYPDGSKDDTHTQRAGAALFARITAELLRKNKLI